MNGRPSAHLVMRERVVKKLGGFVASGAPVNRVPTSVRPRCVNPRLVNKRRKEVSAACVCIRTCVCFYDKSAAVCAVIWGTVVPRANSCASKLLSYAMSYVPLQNYVEGSCLCYQTGTGETGPHLVYSRSHPQLAPDGVAPRMFVKRAHGLVV